MIFETLLVLNVQCKATSNSNDGSTTEYRLRIGGHDKRQMIFKGWVVIEKFIYKDHAEGSFVVMKRDEVSKNARLLRTRNFIFIISGQSNLLEAALESDNRVRNRRSPCFTKMIFFFAWINVLSYLYVMYLEIHHMSTLQ